MKRLLAVLVMLTVLATPVLADTNIWTWTYNSGGYTKYAEQTAVGGLDWSEGRGDYGVCDCSDGWIYPPTPKMTVYIDEGFENDGQIKMFKGIETAGPWELEEYKMIAGSGETVIWKNVDVWTEDTRWNCCTGKLCWPTEAWVEVDFSTPKPFWDAESWYVYMDEPDGHDDINPTPDPQTATFNKMIWTNEDFNFQQKVGINNFPSDFEPPEPPEPPEFHWIGW